MELAPHFYELRRSGGGGTAALGVKRRLGPERPTEDRSNNELEPSKIARLGD